MGDGNEKSTVFTLALHTHLHNRPFQFCCERREAKRREGVSLSPSSPHLRISACPHNTACLGNIKTLGPYRGNEKTQKLMCHTQKFNSKISTYKLCNYLKKRNRFDTFSLSKFLHCPDWLRVGICLPNDFIYVLL